MTLEQYLKVRNIHLTSLQMKVALDLLPNLQRLETVSRFFSTPGSGVTTLFNVLEGYLKNHD